MLGTCELHCCCASLFCALLSPCPSRLRRQFSFMDTAARALRPENTLPAFEYAIAKGVDALEMDMAVTKDNVIVISHDPILRPPVCTGPVPSAVIHTLPLAEVRRWDCGAVRNPNFPNQVPVPGTRVPTLDDVFRLAPRGT